MERGFYFNEELWLCVNKGVLYLRKKKIKLV